MKNLKHLTALICLLLSVAAASETIVTEKMVCRDPFIFYHKETDTYYLHANGGNKLICYTSKDLKNWQFSGNSFVPSRNFWGKQDFWAPDLYEYKGKYYLFVTFSGEGYKRGTSILVSSHPGGPFAPLVNAPATPKAHQCLDGSLFIDDEGKPWMIYCREWLEVINGQVCAIRMSDDLKKSIGRPIVLFKAGDAPWVGNIEGQGVSGKVTDAPYIVRGEDGKLIMLWSSFSRGKGYAIGMAYSDGGIEGPWIQDPKPLRTGGGHSMLFRTRDGQLMISYHAPNTSPSYLTLKPAEIRDNKVYIE